MVNFTKVCPDCGEEFWDEHYCQQKYNRLMREAAEREEAAKIEAENIRMEEQAKTLGKLMSARYPQEAVSGAIKEFENTLSKVPDVLGTKDTWDYVMDDIRARNEMGRLKYGVTLRPDTGEDMLQHLYEELLDATVYIKTEILKRQALKNPEEHF